MDRHTIKMSGYSDTARSSPLTVTLFCSPNTVTGSGEECSNDGTKMLLLTRAKMKSALWIEEEEEAIRSA